MRIDWYFYDSVFTAAFYLKMIYVNLATMPWGLGQTSNYLSWILITKDSHCESVETLQSQNLIPDFPPSLSMSFSKYMLPHRCSSPLAILWPAPPCQQRPKLPMGLHHFQSHLQLSASLLALFCLVLSKTEYIFQPQEKSDESVFFTSKGGLYHNLGSALAWYEGFNNSQRNCKLYSVLSE